VGSKKPNDLGFFDMHGNVFTWCQESYKNYPTPTNGEITDDKEDEFTINPSNSRVLRGGSFSNPAGNVRSAYRYWLAPANRHPNVGFRPARTFTP
jgi:formylglycine-generating enzyme required for sulfatase activity